MECKAVLTRIVALADGELVPIQADEVRAHLLTCAECAQAAAETRRVQQLAAAWNTDSGEVWDAVRAEISTAEVETLSTAVNALRAEVRALRAEVALLRTTMVPSEAMSPRTHVVTQPSRATRSQSYLRIV